MPRDTELAGAVSGKGSGQWGSWPGGWEGDQLVSWGPLFGGHPLPPLAARVLPGSGSSAVQLTVPVGAPASAQSPELGWEQELDLEGLLPWALELEQGPKATQEAAWVHWGWVPTCRGEEVVGRRRSRGGLLSDPRACEGFGEMTPRGYK